MLLHEALRPDPGFELDHALITTYSLDLTALLSVPLALTFHDWREADDGQPSVDPIGLLEALRANAEKLTVVCQAGQIAVPAPQQQNVFAFLEDAVIQVTAPKGGVFHPKAWVLRFSSPADDEVRYRFLCLSRNLTYDRSWDVALRLDGKLRPGERKVKASAGAARFAAGVAGLAANTALPADEERLRELRRLADELARVEFEPPEEFEELRFHPLGLGHRSADPFDVRRDRTLVISPFLTAGTLERLAEAGPCIVVSRQESLDELPGKTREVLEQSYVLDPAADAEPLDADATAEGTDGQPVVSFSGLHAKAYVADCGWDAWVWVGSANATEAAFSSNVELLVELSGKKSRCGINAILGADGDAGLLNLLQAYTPDVDAEADEDLRRAERLADVAARAIGAYGLELRAKRTEGGFALTLDAPGDLKLDPGVAVTARPITLGAEKARGLTPGAPLSWEGLEARQISAFLALEVTARHGSAECTRRATVRARLHGDPEDRKAEVMRSVLSSPEKLLRYLAFLLSDPDADAATAVEMIEMVSREPGVSDPGEGNGTPEFPLFENLVRALARDPRRIDRVARLVADLTRTEEGAALLPPDFERIWKPIWQARQELIK
jgi:hypothetical protein